MSLGNKKIYKSYLDAFAHPGEQRMRSAVQQFFADDADINVVHPFNAVGGSAGYWESLLQTLLTSFDGLYRRDYILMAGSYESGDWVSSTGYYAGRFARDWLGIHATNRLAYLRVGEFHRMEGGKAVESYIYLDIPELMIASGQWPDIATPADITGYTGFLPGPATQDGLQMHENDPALSQSSFKLVSDMLLGLATEDEAWRPYWHDNMVWYGPAAFGSYLGVAEFRAFQVPFENHFSHWHGGSKPESETRHFTRHGDGNYVCSGGWPSLNCKQIKPFLSQPVVDKVLYMRVCDWWRREGDVLVENWVFVDIPDALLQLGYDLFGKLERDDI